MKIIQGLKRLKLCEKKISQNCVDIEKYASKLNIEAPIFSSDAEQKKAVDSLVQANIDLFDEILVLRRKIEQANRSTPMTVGDRTLPIADWLHIRRSLCDQMLATYGALNPNAAQGRARSVQPPEGVNVQIFAFYDEGDKNKNLKYWHDLRSEIDGVLEVTNAVTDLLVD